MSIHDEVRSALDGYERGYKQGINVNRKYATTVLLAEMLADHCADTKEEAQLLAYGIVAYIESEQWRNTDD